MNPSPRVATRENTLQNNTSFAHTSRHLIAKKLRLIAKIKLPSNSPQKTHYQPFSNSLSYIRHSFSQKQQRLATFKLDRTRCCWKLDIVTNFIYFCCFSMIRSNIFILDFSSRFISSFLLYLFILFMRYTITNFTVNNMIKYFVFFVKRNEIKPVN